MEKFLPLVPTP